MELKKNQLQKYWIGVDETNKQKKMFKERETPLRNLLPISEDVMHNFWQK